MTNYLKSLSLIATVIGALIGLTLLTDPAWDYFPVAKLIDQRRPNNPVPKVYIVNLWSTTCKPCVMELPELDSQMMQFNADQVQLLAYSGDDSVRQQVFIDKHQAYKQIRWTMPKGYSDRYYIDNALANAWSTSFDKVIPMTFIVKDDRIVKAYEGYNQAQIDEMFKLVKSLIE